MINIAEKMRELIPVLKAGINDIPYPDVAPECEDQWSEDYAIVCNAAPDTWDQSEYFDHDRLHEDFIELINDHFGGDPSVTVKFYSGCDEIEVYRTKEDEKA